jgi:hypothetical protein
VWHEEGEPVSFAPALLAADPVTDSSTLLLTYGPLGIFTLLAIGAGVAVYKRFNTIWAEREARFRELHAAEKERADAATAALQALQSKVIDIIVPAAERMTMVVADFVAESRRDRDRDRR